MCGIEDEGTTMVASSAASLLRTLSDHRMDKRPGELSEDALAYKHIARGVLLGKSAVNMMRSGSSYVAIEDLEPGEFTDWLEQRRHTGREHGRL